MEHYSTYYGVIRHLLGNKKDFISHPILTGFLRERYNVFHLSQKSCLIETNLLSLNSYDSKNQWRERIAYMTSVRTEQKYVQLSIRFTLNEQNNIYPSQIVMRLWCQFRIWYRRKGRIN